MSAAINDAVEVMRCTSDALDDFYREFADPLTAHLIGDKLTCSEADALAEVLRLVSNEGAEMFLRAHAEGDDEDSGDWHYDYGKDD